MTNHDRQPFAKQDIGYLLTAYADGQLAPEGVMWVEEQLDHNPDLRAKLKEIRQLQAGLRAAFAGGAPVFALDLPRREVVLASAANPPPKRINFMPAIRIALAASVLIMVVVSISTPNLLESRASSERQRDLARGEEAERLYDLNDPRSAGPYPASSTRPVESGRLDSARFAVDGLVAAAGEGRTGIGASNGLPADAPLLAKADDELRDGLRDAKEKSANYFYSGDVTGREQQAQGGRGGQPARDGEALLKQDNLARADRAAPQPSPKGETATGKQLQSDKAAANKPASAMRERGAVAAAPPAATSPAAPAAPPAPVVVAAAPKPKLEVAKKANAESDGRAARKENEQLKDAAPRQAAPPGAAAPAKAEAKTQTIVTGAPVEPTVTDKETPLALIEVPLEEKLVSEDKKSTEGAKRREEAVATSETGSTGTYLAVGAGGGTNFPKSEAEKELARLRRERHVYLRQQQGGDTPAQPTQDIDTRILEAEKRVLEERLESARQSNNEKSHIAQVERAVAFQLNKKLAEAEDDNNNTTVAEQQRLQEMAKAVAENRMRLYDVASLAQSKGSFPGPDLDIPEPNGAGARLLAPIEPDTRPEINELIELIQRVVAPESWAEEGAAIEDYNGKIVVSNTPEVQQKVAEFLADLQEQQKRYPNGAGTSLVYLKQRVTGDFNDEIREVLEQVGDGTVMYQIAPAAEPFMSRQARLEMRDEVVARGVLRQLRMAGLQMGLRGGIVSVDTATRPLDPIDSLGFDQPTFKDLFGTQPMQSIAVDPVQTVAIDADTASYSYAKARVASGQSVDPATIKPEHFINAMPMDYPAATGPEAFSLYAEAAPSPFARANTAWGARTALVTVGAVAKPAAADERKPLALTLAIDCSGSMAQPGGLERIQRGLLAFVEHLRAEDRVAIVAFGDQARVILPATPGNDRAALTSALINLATGGATNCVEGLSLAYQLAAETTAPGVESRVLLATDGGTVAGADDLLRRVTAYKDRGITLVVVGTGKTYHAGPLQELATKGDGQHYYVGSDEDAQELFTGKLLPDRIAVLAKDAKLQVTWNPQRVSHARLVGYDQRRLAAKDFRNNAVDAGELSQDTQVTALFEVLLVDGGTGPLGNAAVRYFDTRRGDVRELACPLPGSILASQPSDRLRLVACAAATAEWLQRGWWSNVHLITPDEIRAQLARCPQPIAAELRAMVK